MCGIAGIVGAPQPTLLRAMCDRLAHRGPDGEGLLAGADGVQLGHRRLAILDLAGGQQPMLLADESLAIVFNGEIYNFAELRRELTQAGAVFRTDHSDTEVLLHGWRAWGLGLFDRLNGMFALALHDRSARRLILARDRFGKKPLYWHAGESLVFASELSALRLHPQAPTAVDRQALRKYYGYGYVPAPLSWIEGVRKLPAGHGLQFDLQTGELAVQRWWRYRAQPDPALAAQPLADLEREFLWYLDRAVARRLVADVPVGAFLSGGIDSSTIAALAMRHCRQDRLRSYSIAFSDDAFDESPHARLVAQHLGCQHQVEDFSVAALRDCLPEMLARLDEPLADASLLPTFLLCRHARREVTVALGGDGADELLAGYDPFRALAPARLYQRFVGRPLHRAISALVSRLPVGHGYMSLDFRLKRTLRGLEHPPRLWLPAWMSPLTPREIGQVLDEPVDIEALYSEAIEAWEQAAGDDVERATGFYIETYLQDDILTKVDRASMLNSLEVRAPFLDIEVVDFLRRLPSTFKLRDGVSKWLLRRAVRELLPAPILKRRKQGFAVPVGRWFHDGTLEAPGKGHPWWRSQAIEHRRGHHDHRLSLWAQRVADAFD
ncbi:MAG: asparagine synthase (glutamine-hydrolyzing) [Xanthomonadales bacterium]|nr:asparagine synthase (glutamine-hydrolyzing) [Xanthomonadales bacterium]